MKKLLLTLLLVGCVFMIFGFSLQPATLSNATSKGITEYLVPKDYPNREAAVRRFNNTFRDAAHVFEYFVLSLILLTVLFKVKLKGFLPYILGFILIFAIAFMDENLQIPVPGRAFEWVDIAKDLTGYLIACILYIIKNTIL